MKSTRASQSSTTAKAPRATAAKSAVAKPKAPKAVKKTKESAPVAHGVGRRKSSVARVFLRPGGKNFTVNGLSVDSYFDTETMRRSAALALMVYEPSADYTIDARVEGGGKAGQADAIKLGVARAFSELFEEARLAYRDAGLLTVDARLKERKKYGQRGARRKFQFVKR